MRSLGITIAFLAFPALVLAQGDTTKVPISGTVVDPLQRPIEGAEVSGMGLGASIMTSADGAFRLLIPRTGETLLQIRRPGFNGQLVKVTGAWIGSIMLTPGAFSLPEVKVTARFAKPVKYAGTNKYDGVFERQRKGFGIFIMKEEIERRNPLYTSDLLQAKAGIKTALTTSGTGTMIYFARCNERRLGKLAAVTPKITVYINGMKQYPEFGSPFNGDLVERVNVADIEMMEIFRGPGELPPEFNDGNCGAIAIWTRQGGK